MGMILKFEARSRETTEQRERQPGAISQCEIILFPGVRYERWSDEDAKPAPQKKRQRRRKKVQRNQA